jgi:hypothetical protein
LKPSLRLDTHAPAAAREAKRQAGSEKLLLLLLLLLLLVLLQSDFACCCFKCYLLLSGAAALYKRVARIFAACCMAQAERLFALQWPTCCFVDGRPELCAQIDAPHAALRWGRH